MTDWDIETGTTLVRRELHQRWGGSRFGGMEPSIKAGSVFLFTKPSVGDVFGYKFDGWHSDGSFHYTGDGQVGDQLETEGGNRALLAAERQGRAIRLFRSEGTNTTYIGEFRLADPPFYRADATDRNGEMRSVLVFKLLPVGAVQHAPIDDAPADINEPEEMPLESTNIDAYAVARPDEPPIAVRREAQLVRRYQQWLEAQGREAVRHRVPLPEGGYLFTDVFDTSTRELIEAKASAGRVYVRAALGQVLDYGRFVEHDRKSLLVPIEPSRDLIKLLHTYGVGVIWPSGDRFARSDP